MSRADPVPMLYDAAVGEAAWVDALAAISRRFDAAGVFLGIGNPHDGSSRALWGVHHDLAPTRAVAWTAAANPAVRGGLVAPVGRSFDRRQIWVDPPPPSDEAFRRDTLISQGHGNNRTFVPLRDRTLLAGGFVALAGDRDIETIAGELDRLVGHIGRALRLRNEIGRHRAVEASLQHALEGLGVGVIVLDADLRVLTANPFAQSILSARDGLSTSRGRLAVAGAARRGLLAALRSAAGNRAVAPIVAVAIPRPSGRAAYVIRVFPATGMAHMSNCASACATITISDPAMSPALPDAAQLRVAFGLTRAEAEVARLVPMAEGRRGIADRLGVSENTVKTHMAAIRQKAGANSTVELARMIERAMLPAHAQSETY